MSYAINPRFVSAPEDFREEAQAGRQSVTLDSPRSASPGRKDDSAKLDMTLVIDDLPHALEAVAEVLQWAVTSKWPTPYERGSWQNVPDFQRRYRAAMIRHTLNAAKSRIAVVAEIDAETGLLELAHIATGALFQLEMSIRKQRGLEVPEGA